MVVNATVKKKMLLVILRKEMEAKLTHIIKIQEELAQLRVVGALRQPEVLAQPVEEEKEEVAEEPENNPPEEQNKKRSPPTTTRPKDLVA